MKKLIEVGVTMACLGTILSGCASAPTPATTAAATTGPQAREHTLADDIGDLSTVVAIDEWKEEHPGEPLPPALQQLQNEANQALDRRQAQDRQPSSPPYAIPVAGRPNLVWSPYVRDKYVDISGLAPGTEVNDPYSPGKTFLVPRTR